MMKNLLKITLPMALAFMVSGVQASEWSAKSTPITTQWGEKVTPDNAWREYPRPTLVRNEWMSLNGLWDYAITNEKLEPASWSGEILVPYPVQSALSGVAIYPDKSNYIWYKREFTTPKDWGSKRVMINFEAVDFEATVYINGKEVGSHLGCYNAFNFDITEYLNRNGSNSVAVRVLDQSDITTRSLGKQSRGDKARDAYEDLSGIWQSVWLEPLSEEGYIRDIKTTANLKDISIDADIVGVDGDAVVEYTLKDDAKIVQKVVAKVGEGVVFTPKSPKLWSPASPHLYDIEVRLMDGRDVIDRVESYCGMRTIQRDGSKILLNDEPIFQMGPLDQNYWPESGLTPPSEDAMLWEIKYLRQIGCNMVRLHIKRNPAIYYTHCDREGLLVWQDFICGRAKNPSESDSDFWFNEQSTMVSQLHNHPSIVMWIVFNEAWGQHNSEPIFNRAEPLDPSRIFSVASGWIDVSGCGSVRDMHDYTFAPSVVVGDSRAVVLGECGGFASAVPPHNWKNRTNGKGSVKNLIMGGFTPSTPRDNETTHDTFRATYTAGEAFDRQYARFVENLRYLKASGLVGAVYTQLTDMKSEENGWLTFDRKVSKVDVEKCYAVHSKLYGPAPIPTIIFASSYNAEPKMLRCATLPMPEGIKGTKGVHPSMVLQRGVEFDKLNWSEAKAPFTYGVGESNTESWSVDKRLVVEREFTMKQTPRSAISLRVYSKMTFPDLHGWVHTRIYVNGEFVMDESTRHDKVDELKMSEVVFNEKAQKLLRSGKNSIAIEVVPGIDRGVLKKGPKSLTVDFELVSWEEPKR